MNVNSLNLFKNKRAADPWAEPRLEFQHQDNIKDKTIIKKEDLEESHLSAKINPTLLHLALKSSSDPLRLGRPGLRRAPRSPLDERC